ncbi:MAG: sulfotransferase [Solirubrobacteraceae bacterium]
MTAPFFIVGNDRSGTTMLRLILDRSPDAAIPPESMFLTDLELDGADPQALADAAWSHPKVALWELSGPSPLIPAGLDTAAARRFALAAPFEAYARKHGKPHWGDKTPHYVNHVGDLLAIWPDARFVVLVRDGRDVALSLRRMPFGPNNAWAAAQWWARGIRAGERAERDHPGQVLTVRYEDLAHDPAAGAQHVCAFLDLRYEDRMLALQDADRSLIVADQRSWFPTLFDGVNTKAVERWRREMGPRDQGVFAALAGAELSRRGYPVPTRPPDAPVGRRADLYRRHNELMRNVNFVRLRVFQERGRELGPALARRLRDPVRKPQ